MRGYLSAIKTQDKMLEKYRVLAEELINKDFDVQGVSMNANSLGYTFEYNHRFRRVLGRCSYRYKVISLSSEYVINNSGVNDNLIVDTILHEIAHAFAHHIHPKQNVGHGFAWQRIARTIGAKPTRSKSGIVSKFKYELVCPNCGHKNVYHRKPKVNKACYKCCNKYSRGYYDEKYKLELVTV